MQAGDKQKAVELARSFVGERANEALPQAVLTAALANAGRWDEAATQFDRLASLAGRADPHLPVFATLQPILERLEISGDWRTPVPFPADFGSRPKLDALGPLNFTRWSAPDWIVPTATGERLDFAELRKSKRAVVVLFYLGAGCVHCVEQLKAFAPLAKSFADEKIAVVAVSTEDREKLKESLNVLAVGERAAFPMIADPTFTLFKQYSAYDDFEKMPLHGTFLVSSDGRVLWRDVGFEPFADAKFLLEESKRLLGRRSKRP
jgi:peroxiredoxin